MPTSVMRDETGSVLVEVTVVMTIMFVFLLGSIEFLFVFYQWNVASKAVEIGLRIAAVSDRSIRSEWPKPGHLKLRTRSGRTDAIFFSHV